jgi:hypothetical protein
MRERRILDLTEVTKGPLTRWRSPTAWRTCSEYFCNSHGLNTVRVLARAPQIEHTVQIQKFQRWLAESRHDAWGDDGAGKDPRDTGRQSVVKTAGTP